MLDMMLAGKQTAKPPEGRAHTSKDRTSLPRLPKCHGAKAPSSLPSAKASSCCRLRGPKTTSSCWQLTKASCNMLQ